MAEVSELSVEIRMRTVTVVGIDHVAACAPAAPVVPRVIIGAWEIQERIKEACLLEPQESGIGAKQRAKTAVAQFSVRPPWLFFRRGIALLSAAAAAALKNSQHIARLRNLPSFERLQVRQDSFCSRLLRGWRRPRLQLLRDPVSAVAFTKVRVLQGKRAVVIEGGAPQHGAVSHHAGAHVSHFRRMASRCSTGAVGDAKVSWIDELDILGALAEPLGIAPYRVRGRADSLLPAWSNVRFELGLFVSLRATRHT
ncbi:MAG: hypothetical protein DMG67_04720 [Acidobacteria bacterium]|nr:MAG: hypothetical protein DMG67_04720 [Acidobacteriota bacterium]